MRKTFWPALLVSASLALAGCKSDRPRPININTPAIESIMQSTAPNIVPENPLAKCPQDRIKNGCCKIENEAVCADDKIIVRGPAKKMRALARERDKLREQYEFLKAYLGFEPKKILRLDYLEKDEFRSICGAASGCAWCGHMYMPVSQIMPRPELGDHEMNHAYLDDIRLDGDLNEALARYLAMKEVQHEKRKSLRRALNHGYFYTPLEGKWLTPSLKPESACSGVKDDFLRQCKFLFWMVRTDKENVVPRLLKDAYNDRLDLKRFELPLETYGQP